MRLTRIITGRVAGILPYAHVVHGSTIKRTLYGFTTAHVAARAERWERWPAEYVDRWYFAGDRLGRSK
ncbi:hypothetical protein [Agromyces humi]|uniref:hypothetical protein n=1 Tax=Agromyces humi TaxID=1766800 RepID=UPI00135A8AC5|nr:hypothetical protein [Agromyces humi]